MREREVDLDSQQEALRLLEKVDFEPEKRHLNQVRLALINPVRGALNTDAKKAVKEGIIDLASRKIRLIEHLSRMLRSEHSDEVFLILWETVVSVQPGNDISYDAATAIKLDNENLSPLAVDTLRKALDCGEARTERFAAYILGSSSYGYINETRYRKRMREADAYEDSGVRMRCRIAASNFGSLEGWAALEIYRRTVEKINANEPDFNLAALVSEAATETMNLLRECRDDIYEDRDTSMGVEVQGITFSSVPQVMSTLDRVYTRYSGRDYKKIAELAGFIRSNDQYFEFSLHPNVSVREQVLVLGTVYALSMFDYKEGSTSLHITVGGLETSESFREPAAMQILLLGADWCRSDILMNPGKYKASWDLHENKRALRNRFADELEVPAGGYDTSFAAEMRLPALDSFDITGRALFTLKSLAYLAKENQKYLRGVRYDTALKGAWDEIMDEADDWYRRHKLPGLQQVWTLGELTRLNDLIKSRQGKEFVDGVRGILIKARRRAKDCFGQPPEMVEGVEINPIEERGLIEVLEQYEDLVHRVDELIVDRLARDRNIEARAVALRATRLVRQTIPDVLIYSILSSVAGVSGVTPEQLMQLGLIGAGLHALIGPEGYVSLVKFLKSFLKKERLTVEAELIDVLDINSSFVRLPLVFHVPAALLTGRYGSVITSVAWYLGSRSGMGLFRQHKAIEAYPKQKKVTGKAGRGQDGN